MTYTIDSEPKMPKLLTVREVMAVSTLCRRSIYNFIAANELKPIKLGGKTVFAEEHVREWLAAKIKQAA